MIDISSFNTEKLQLDEGYFPAHAWHLSKVTHRRLCRVKKMLAMYLKYHKAGLTPTTPVTSIAISPVKMSIERKSLTNLRSEMIFLQVKPFFYIFLPSTPPY